MTLADPTITNEEFLAQFECQTLDPVHFNHVGHIRIACIYLNKYEVKKANKKVCDAIKLYAESLGATNKFNLTLTDAIVKIMANRMKGSADNTWEVFIENNQDIVCDAIGVLNQYFSKEVLFSEQARTSLVNPDIKPI